MTRLALAALAVAVIVGSASAADLPSSAFIKVRACMFKVGAISVQRHRNGGGLARFPGTYKWMSWSFVLVNGRVAGVGIGYTLAGRQKRVAATCLAPYKG